MRKLRAGLCASIVLLCVVENFIVTYCMKNNAVPCWALLCYGIGCAYFGGVFGILNPSRWVYNHHISLCMVTCLVICCGIFMYCISIILPAILVVALGCIILGVSIVSKWIWEREV